MADNATESQAQTGNATPDNNGGSATAEERKYSASEVEKIVKDRLARAEKKFSQKSAEQPTAKPSGNVEEDLRSKLNQFESSLKTITEKYERTRSENLRSTVEKKLAENGCIDPDLVADRFLTKGLVRYDDDDSILVENADNNLESLIRDELNKRPHLVKSQSKGGAGSKGPAAFKSPTTNPAAVASMTPEEFAAFKANKYGIVPANSKRWLTGD